MVRVVLTNTRTATTQVLLNGAAEIDVPTTTQVLWHAGIERRVRCFLLRFRSTTSGSSQIASGVVGPDTVRTASAYAGAMPVLHGTSSTPDAAARAYLHVEVAP